MSRKAPRSPDFPKAAVENLRRGNLIDAIKIVRQERNIGFKEAKEVVEIYISSQPAIKKKMGKVLVSAQQKFVRWMVGLLLVVVGVVVFILLGR